MSKRTGVVMHHVTEQDTDSTQISDSTETRIRTTKGSNARLLNQPVLIPCLEKASEYTNDAEWQGKLKAAARNKFPPGFYHRNNTIYHHHRGKEHDMLIPEDPMEAATRFIGFLQKFGGFYSDRDVEYSRMNKTVVGSLTTRRSQTWTDCTKQERHKVLSDYAHFLVEDYGLDEEAYEQINGVLRLGVLLGVFCSKTIHMDDGVINEIDGLEYDSSTSTFVISPDALASKKADFRKKRIAQTQARSVTNKNMHHHPAYMPRRVDIPGEWRRYLDLFHTITQRSDKDDVILPSETDLDEPIKRSKTKSQPTPELSQKTKLSRKSDIKSTKDSADVVKKVTLKTKAVKPKTIIQIKCRKASPGRKENHKIPVKPNIESDDDTGDFLIVD